MSRFVPIGATALAAVAVLGLAGCRDGGSTALPPTVAATSRPLPPAASVDPLARVEDELDALEREVADVEGGRTPAR